MPAAVNSATSTAPYGQAPDASGRAPTALSGKVAVEKRAASRESLLHQKQTVLLLDMFCRLKGNPGAPGGMRRGPQAFMPHIFPAGDGGRAFHGISVVSPLSSCAQPPRRT